MKRPDVENLVNLSLKNVQWSGGQTKCNSKLAFVFLYATLHDIGSLSADEKLI